MKEYNRQTKRWEEKEKIGSLKKPKLCRGQKPHQYFLILPEYIKTTCDPSVEATEEYYRSDEKVHKFIQNEHAKLNTLGIVINTWSGNTYKLFRCAVCGKRDYQFDKKTTCQGNQIVKGA